LKKTKNAIKNLGIVSLPGFFIIVMNACTAFTEYPGKTLLNRYKVPCPKLIQAYNEHQVHINSYDIQKHLILQVRMQRKKGVIPGLLKHIIKSKKDCPYRMGI
jgi:hypothetical protein